MYLGVIYFDYSPLDETYFAVIRDLGVSGFLIIKTKLGYKKVIGIFTVTSWNDGTSFVLLLYLRLFFRREYD